MSYVPRLEIFSKVDIWVSRFPEFGDLRAINIEECNSFSLHDLYILHTTLISKHDVTFPKFDPNLLGSII